MPNYEYYEDVEMEENELEKLGNIHGASSMKFGLYYGKSEKDTIQKYRFSKIGIKHIPETDRTAPSVFYVLFGSV